MTDLEDILKESLEFIYLSNLLDHSADFIYFKDRESRFTKISKSLADKIGEDQEDIIGKTDHDFQGTKHADQAYADEQKIIQTGESIINIEEKEIWPDGQVKWVSTTKHPLKDSHGNIIGTYGISRDITKSKIQETRLIQTEKLEDINQSISTYNHDLNNDLTPLIGYLPMLKKMLQENEDPRLSEIVNECITATNKIRSKIQAFKKYSKKEDYNFQHFYPGHYIESRKDSFKQLIQSNEEKQIELVTDLNAINKIYVDQNKLDDILNNIIANARDAIDKKGQIIIDTKDIDLNKEYCEIYPEAKEGSYVMISITDDGCGMDKETKQKMFNPFYTTKDEGAGLGMCSIRDIAKMHESFVNVYSEINKGTTVNLYLPASRNSQMIGEGIMKGTESILIIDDDEVVLNMAQKTLTNCGYTVITSKNEKEALEIYRSNIIDGVLLDLTINGHDTFPTFRDLRLLNPTAKIILSSGYSEKAIESQEIIKKSSGYLSKPYTTTALNTTLRAVLDS